MKLIMLILLFANYAFAIKDILYKPFVSGDDYVARRVLFSTQPAYYPESKETKITEDEYNVFSYSEHFRIVLGKSYKDDEEAKTLASGILNIAENVWNKEIDTYGFKSPTNSTEDYIDIYIGNKESYNKATSTYENISNAYAGFADGYNDKTPYFVINPSIDTDILKVTIAHEFFHTIQYAYGFFDVSDDIWYQNIWFLEASAVMMEDEVYDSVNDYVNYISSYIRHTEKSLQTHDGDIEYGKVVFAKFLKEKYGMDFIKSILESYDSNENVLQDIIKCFAKTNVDFDTAFSLYATWLYNPSYFRDGNLYPTLLTHSLSNQIDIEYYGINFISQDMNRSYLYGNNSNYMQETFDGETNTVGDIDNSGLIVINKKAIEPLNTGLLQKNHFDGFVFRKGWNLCGNNFDTDLNLQDFLQNQQTAWTYENNHYYGFSKDIDYEQKIESMGYNMPIPSVKKGKGFWIYSPNDTNTTISPIALQNSNKDTGVWNLVSFDSVFNPKYLDENYTIIWQYDNGWQYYSKKYDFNITKIDTIKPAKGYFIH